MKHRIFWATAAALFLIWTYLYATTYTVNQAVTVSGLFTANGHTVLEGVTSTGATGTGKLVYDTSPTIATAILTTPNIGSAAVNGTNYCADAAGSGTTYTCTITGLSAYTTGMLVSFKPGTANTGASTVNITSLGAKSIIADNTTGSALVADDLLTGTGQIYTLYYDGTAFRKIDGPDGAWTGFSYANSWTDFGGGYQAGQYRKLRNGVVEFRGLIKAGTLTAGTTIINLPAGYRPPTLIDLVWFGAPAAGSQQIPGQIDIQAGGAVVTQTLGTLFGAAGGWNPPGSFSVY